MSILLSYAFQNYFGVLKIELVDKTIKALLLMWQIYSYRSLSAMQRFSVCTSFLLRVYWTSLNWPSSTPNYCNRTEWNDNLCFEFERVIQYNLKMGIVLQNRLVFIISNWGILTHLPLVSHICVSESGQYWFRLWFVVFLAPSHYLNQCSGIVNWTPRNKRQWNCNRNPNIFIHENTSENIVCEMAAILPRWRWVKQPFASRM